MSEFLKKLAAHPEMLPLSPGYRRFEAILLARGKAEGKAEGKREALLELCAARGLRLGPAQRGRVLACRDLRVLERWIRRAAVADTAASVLRVTESSARRRPNGRRATDRG